MLVQDRKKIGQILLLRRIKIQYRLLIVFFFISLVPVICIGSYAYSVYTKSINGKLGESSQQAILSLNKNMVTELGKFQDYCSILSVSAPIQESLSAVSEKGEPMTREMITSISQISTTIPFQSNYLKNLRVADMNGNILYDLGYDDIPKERFSDLLDNVDAASPNDCLDYIHTYRSTDRLVLGRKLYALDSISYPIGYIMVYIDERLISDKIFSDVSFGEDSNIMLVSSDGWVISSQNRKQLGEQLSPSNLFDEIRERLKKGENAFNTEVEGEPSLVIAAYNSQFNNYLVASIPRTYITNETRTINRTLLLLAMFLIFLSVGCTLLVYLSIIKPILNMVTFCSMTPTVLPSFRICDRNPDELGVLGRKLDDMMDNLEMLMERRKEDDIRKRDLELQMLQYQINPHFLFNTLNSLQWVAVVNDVPVLSEGISSLSALLRNTLVKKDEFISLKEEIDNLKHYFSIQCIRYGNSFDVDYQLSEDTLNCMIPRFILQPLAENAVIHGAADALEAITITVYSAWVEDMLVIELRDNGKGFDEEKKNYEKKEFILGIGIQNVKERLKIYYGTEDCLQVSSKAGKGTVCRIMILPGQSAY